MSASHTPVLILGAGLTGLATALFLEERGIPYRLVEKLGHVGGHAITVEEQGFRFDRTGHLLHLRDDEVRARVLPLLGEHVEVARQSVVWSHDRVTRYPFQANTFGLPPEVAYACLMGFLEARFSQDGAKERKEPENFEEFCLAHFGRGISEHFMIPYNTRLWGVSPREITAAWCSRFVPLPKLEDVVAGAVGLADRELGYNARFVYPRRGIGALPEGLAGALRGHVELGRAPLSIDPVARTALFDDELLRWDVLVSTAPLPRLVERLEGVPTPVREASSRLRCSHLHYLDVAADEPAGRPYHWVYVPEARHPFYRVGCYSNFSDAMAPPGGSCFYVELADRSPPDLEALVPIVADGLVALGYLSSAKAVRFVRARRIDHAYVLFDHAYYDALAAVRPYLEAHHVLSAGRYGGWNYSSMEDAILFGRDAAQRAAALLSAGAP